MSTRVVSKTINLEAAPEQVIEKYITRISDRGISIHPENTTVNKKNVLIDGEGISILDNNSVLASFKANGSQIGLNNESRLEMDYHSMRFIDKEGNPYLYISDLRNKDDDWKTTITETFLGDGVEFIFKVHVTPSDEVSATDSSDSTNNARRNGLTYTFSHPPADGATITIVYKTSLPDMKAYTLGKRVGLVGPYSFAEGYDIQAVGFNSHAEGYETAANGYASHAEGYGAIAKGDYSHAEGMPIEGETAHHTMAIGKGSHAEGEGAIAKGNYCHAEGGGVYTFQNVDYYTISDGIYSHAEGWATTADGVASHAEGFWTKAFGYSHAEGNHTQATGMSSHTEGSYSKATNHEAHAEGGYTTASGSYAHAEGGYTTASGNYTHAEGVNTTASGAYSHAQNGFTVATETYQTSIGRYNAATRTGSGTSEEPYVYSDAGNYAFIIGNGTDDNTASRSNALTVDWQGRIEAGDYSGNFKSIFDIFYPVGSYYETSLPGTIPSGSQTPTAADIANLGTTWFDPNYAWGGTWALEAEGKTHISAGSSYTAGTSYGANSKNYTPQGSTADVTLSAAQCAVQSHSHTLAHTHPYSKSATATEGHTLTTSELPQHTHGKATLTGTFGHANLYNGNAFASGIVSHSAGTNATYTGQSSNERARVTWTINASHTHDNVGENKSHTHGITLSSANTSAASVQNTGDTSKAATKAHKHTFTGTQASINVMQASIAVYRWHRTA